MSPFGLESVTSLQTAGLPGVVVAVVVVVVGAVVVVVATVEVGRTARFVGRTRGTAGRSQGRERAAMPLWHGAPE